MSEKMIMVEDPVAMHGLAKINEANVKAKHKKLTLGQLEGFLLKSAERARTHDACSR